MEKPERKTKDQRIAELQCNLDELIAAEDRQRKTQGSVVLPSREYHELILFLFDHRKKLRFVRDR